MRTQWMVGLTLARLALARTKACRPALPAMQTGLKHFLLLAALGLLLAVVPNASAVYQIAQVNITSPAPGQVVTNQILAATGSVTRFSTSVAVSNLWCQLNGGGWTAVVSANGWTNWSSDLFTLSTGSNTVSAYLVDINGNVSATNTVTFDYQVTAGGLFAGPPGTNGLFATEYETFFPTDAGPNYFTGFSLLPNAVYLPLFQTNTDSSISAQAPVFGPLPSVLSGQE